MDVPAALRTWMKARPAESDNGIPRGFLDSKAAPLRGGKWHAMTPGQHWDAIPQVIVRYHERATGKPDLVWHVYCASLLRAVRKGKARMLVVGCGTGSLERDLYRRRTFEACDVIDPSIDRIEAARTRAEREGCRGITYIVEDLNSVVLPKSSYDAVWFDLSLGMVTALERLAEQTARALKPEGLAFINGYVGPQAHALGRRQREAVQAAFSLIPARLRRRNGRLETPPQHEPPVFSAPEALSVPPPSANLVPIFTKYFDFVEYHPIGGTLLQFALEGIASNFESGEPTSTKVLEMLFHIEDALVDSGELGSDFLLIIAKAKKARKAVTRGPAKEGQHASRRRRPRQKPGENA
jgi:SAM-dependent methyltransferase